MKKPQTSRLSKVAIGLVLLGALVTTGLTFATLWPRNQSAGPTAATGNSPFQPVTEPEGEATPTAQSIEQKTAGSTAKPTNVQFDSAPISNPALGNNQTPQPTTNGTGSPTASDSNQNTPAGSQTAGNQHPPQPGQSGSLPEGNKIPGRIPDAGTGSPRRTDPGKDEAAGRPDSPPVLERPGRAPGPSQPAETSGRTREGTSYPSRPTAGNGRRSDEDVIVGRGSTRDDERFPDNGGPVYDGSRRDDDIHSNRRDGGYHRERRNRTRDEDYMPDTYPTSRPDNHGGMRPVRQDSSNWSGSAIWSGSAGKRERVTVFGFPGIPVQVSRPNCKGGQARIVTPPSPSNGWRYAVVEFERGTDGCEVSIGWQRL